MATAILSFCVLVSTLLLSTHATVISPDFHPILKQEPCLPLTDANSCLAKRDMTETIHTSRSIFEKIMRPCSTHFCCVPATSALRSDQVQLIPKFLPGCPVAGQSDCIPEYRLPFVQWCASEHGSIAHGWFRITQTGPDLCGLYCTTRPPPSLLHLAQGVTLPPTTSATATSATTGSTATTATTTATTTAATTTTTTSTHSGTTAATVTTATKSPPVSTITLRPGNTIRI